MPHININWSKKSTYFQHKIYWYTFKYPKKHKTCVYKLYFNIWRYNFLFKHLIIIHEDIIYGKHRKPSNRLCHYIHKLCIKHYSWLVAIFPCQIMGIAVTIFHHFALVSFSLADLSSGFYMLLRMKTLIQHSHVHYEAP